MGESFQCKSPGVRGGGMVMAKIDNCIKAYGFPKQVKFIPMALLLVKNSVFMYLTRFLQNQCVFSKYFFPEQGQKFFPRQTDTSPFMCLLLCISQFQAPTSPQATPSVLHSTAAPGPRFILEDLPRGPGFCISIKLRFVQ